MVRLRNAIIAFSLASVQLKRYTGSYTEDLQFFLPPAITTSRPA